MRNAILKQRLCNKIYKKLKIKVIFCKTIYKFGTYANKPRNRVSRRDKMAKSRVLVHKPGFCVVLKLIDSNREILPN